MAMHSPNQPHSSQHLPITADFWLPGKVRSWQGDLFNVTKCMLGLPLT